MNRIHPVSLFLTMLLLIQAGSVSGLCCLEMQGSSHHAEGSLHHAEGSHHAGHQMAGHRAGHDMPEAHTQSVEKSGCESLTCTLQGCSSSAPALASVTLATDLVSVSTTAGSARFDLYQTGVDSLYRPPKS
jgi:hypothetical protein